MRSMPEILSPNRCPFATYRAYRPHLAASAVGARHCRTTTHSTRESKIHLHSRRIFHQMDRGQSSLHNNIEDRTNFFWQNIVCRFGVPSKLTVDNDKQFDNQDFREFCSSIGTKAVFASVYHPQSNGVVERANSKIFSTIKKRLLDDKKGKWADQLPEVIWALNTTRPEQPGSHPFA
jgi:transposase InsO family protein